MRYSDLKELVQTRPRTISLLVFKPRSKALEIQLTSGETREAHYPSDESALALEELLDDRGVAYDSTGSGRSAWGSILTYLLPFLLFIGFWIFLMRQVQGKGRDDRRGMSEAESVDQAEDATRHPGTYR